MGYEIAEQLGWRCPDVILYPTGGGVGIIAIYKALLEMRELGWITGDLPRLVAVQAAGCAPIVDAFERGARREHGAGRPAHRRLRHHRAQGARRLPGARRRAATGGTAVAVTDEELLAAQRQLARDEGTWVCPEGAACFAARRAAARVGLAGRQRGRRRAQHRHRPAVPGHRAGRRPDAGARREDPGPAGRVGRRRARSPDPAAGRQRRAERVRLDLPEGWRRGIFNGYVLSWDPTVTARLRELHESGRVELQWLTTWTEKADQLLAEPMGLPRGLRTHSRDGVLPTGFSGDGAASRGGGSWPRPVRSPRLSPDGASCGSTTTSATRPRTRVSGWRPRPGAGRGAGPLRRAHPRGAGPGGGWLVETG